MKSWLQIAVISVLLLIIIELFLRVYEKAFSPVDMSISKESAFIFHPERLIELKPDIDKLYYRSDENGGDTIKWSVNSDGFRGNEIDTSYDIRIMIYGDSNIQARFSVEESTLVNKLQNKLGVINGFNNQVINAGVVGYGPDQSYLKFREEAEQFMPDLVILNIFTGNDFGDLIRNRIFEIGENDQLIKTNFDHEIDSELIKRDEYKIYVYEMIKRLSEQLFNNTKERSNSEYQEGVFKYFEEQNEMAFTNYLDGGNTLISNFQDSYDTDIAVNPESDSAILKMKLFSLILNEFKFYADSLGIKFVVLVQPSATDLTNNYVLGESFLSSNFESYEPQRLSQLAEKSANSIGIPVLNLYQEFAANTPSKLFFKGTNNHWNDTGQELTAKLLADFLQDSVSLKVPLIK